MYACIYVYMHAYMYIYLNAYICSAQSRNRYNSGIVLRKVGILTLLRKVGILTLRKTISELSNSGIVSAQSENRDKVRIIRYKCV